MEQNINRIIILVLFLFFVSCKDQIQEKKLEAIIMSAEINTYSEGYLTHLKPNISFIAYINNHTTDTIVIFIYGFLYDSLYSNFFLINNKDTLGNLFSTYSGKKLTIVEIPPKRAFITYLQWKTFDPYKQSLNDVYNNNKFLETKEYKIVYKNIKEACYDKIIFKFSDNYQVRFKFDDDYIAFTDSVRLNYKNQIPVFSDTNIIEVL